MENNSEQSLQDKMKAREELKKNFSAWVKNKIEKINSKFTSLDKPQ